MNPGIDTEICRVTVIGPRRRVDIALPPYVPFADLFPGVARFCGLDRNTLARAPGGWVLQRLGQPPFQPSATPASAGLLDGELIYLRPCAAELPEVSSDDVADEISGVHDGPDRWGPADAQRIAFGAGAAALVAGVAVIARSGPPWTIPAAAAGAVAAALLVAAAAVSRAAGDAGAGALLGYAALPYAFFAGLAGTAQTAPLSHLRAPDVLAGFAIVPARRRHRGGRARARLAGILRRRRRCRLRRCGGLAGAGVQRYERRGRRGAHGDPGAGADAAHPGRGVPDGRAFAAAGTSHRGRFAERYR